MSNEGDLAHDPAPAWIKVASTADFESREAMQATVGGLEIAIFKIASGFYATDAFCTHALALLCDGYVEGEEVECPLHAARFHIPTGKVLSPPAIIDLKTYPLKVVENDILLSFT